MADLGAKLDSSDQEKIALDSLENDYLEDMLGTGLTLFGGGDRNFGFIPMVLADTKGNNLRAHHRKADNRNNYVDFATNVANGGTPTQMSFLSLKGRLQLHDSLP